MMSRLLACLIIAMLAITGCKKDSPSDPNANGTLTAKIDGQSWTAELTVYGSVSGPVFQITGSDNAAKQLQVIIHDYSGSGTYALGGSVTANNMSSGRWTAGLATAQTYSTQVGLGNGTCTITENGNRLEGTFSFTAKNTDDEAVEVTEGKFTVNL